MKHTHTLDCGGIEVAVTFYTEYVNNQIDRPNGLGIEHVRQLEIECMTYDRSKFTEDEQHIIESYLLNNRNTRDEMLELAQVAHSEAEA